MQKITVADYLIKRLVLLGIKKIFGLPGDYNFNILDAIIKNSSVDWINSVNELNAGYSADGYARVAGFGAVVTTYGVGELSVINAIAGCSSESVPVISIVGIPKSKSVKNKSLIHHNLQEADYHAFSRAFSNVVETVAYLDFENAKSEIDRIIDVMVKKRKPVYIAIPMDVCLFEIEDKVPLISMQSDKNNLLAAIQNASKIINESKNPIFITDFLLRRFGLDKAMQKIINKTNIPACSLLMGKSVLDETEKTYMGTYLGIMTPEIDKKVEASDCVVSFGTVYSDLNTGGFSIQRTSAFKIYIQPDYTEINGVKYINVLMKDMLAGLYDTLDIRKVKLQNYTDYKKAEAKNKKLTLDYVFPRLQTFFRNNDLIFVDTGVSSFAAGLMKLSSGCSFNNQMLWGSIGWATPAIFGGAMADSKRRPILITGEGAHQLTIQEISNMLLFDIKPIIIVINNHGYTIERVLSKNPKDKYNDIKNWNYTRIPEVFGGNYYSCSALSEKEFDNCLKEAELMNKKVMCYIEIFTEKLDVPKCVKNFMKAPKNKTV